MNDLRRVEVLKEDKWEETTFQNLQPGNVFRMFNPGGGRVLGKGPVLGSVAWKVTGYPYTNEDGIWTVDCDYDNAYYRGDLASDDTLISL